MNDHNDCTKSDESLHFSLKRILQIKNKGKTKLRKLAKVYITKNKTKQQSTHQHNDKVKQSRKLDPFPSSLPNCRRLSAAELRNAYNYLPIKLPCSTPTWTHYTATETIANRVCVLCVVTRQSDENSAGEISLLHENIESRSDGGRGTMNRTGPRRTSYILRLSSDEGGPSPWRRSDRVPCASKCPDHGLSAEIVLQPQREVVPILVALCYYIVGGYCVGVGLLQLEEEEVDQVDREDSRSCFFAVHRELHRNLLRTWRWVFEYVFLNCVVCKLINFAKMLQDWV